jgi:membrane associated rhomboid family serine protease
MPDPPEVQAREERKAAIRAALAERGTRVLVTPILLAANIAVFVLVAVQERQIVNVDADVLLNWGASYSPDVTQGAWWRLMTAVFLHGGILHLAANMIALAVIGPVTERLFGSRAFVVLYALAGVGGAVASE